MTPAERIIALEDLRMERCRLLSEVEHEAASYPSAVPDPGVLTPARQAENRWVAAWESADYDRRHPRGPSIPSQRAIEIREANARRLTAVFRARQVS